MAQDKEVIKQMADALERKREKRGLNIVDYSKLLGISSAIYYDLLKGNISEHYSKIYESISKELGLSGYDLFLTINNPTYKHQLHIMNRIARKEKAENEEGK